MTETLYKLVRDDYTTRDGFRWEIGKRHRATGARGQGLCSSEYVHGYRSLAHAELMKSVHGCLEYTRALEVEGKVHEDDGTKVGMRECFVVREVEPVHLTSDQRAAIAIVCVSRVYRNEKWLEWARNWMSGRDRSSGTTAACYSAAHYAAYYAAAAPAAAAAAAAADEIDDDDAAASAHYAAYYAARTGYRLDIPAICEAVLSARKDEWEKLLEVSDD